MEGGRMSVWLHWGLFLLAGVWWQEEAWLNIPRLFPEVALLVLMIPSPSKTPLYLNSYTLQIKSCRM